MCMGVFLGGELGGRVGGVGIRKLTNWSQL